MLFDSRFIVLVIFYFDQKFFFINLTTIDFNYFLKLISTAAFCANLLFPTSYLRLLNLVSILHPVRTLITLSMPVIKSRLFQFSLLLLFISILSGTVLWNDKIYFLGFLILVFFVTFASVTGDLAIVQFYLALSILLVESTKYSNFVFVSALILDSIEHSRETIEPKNLSFTTKTSGKIIIACMSLFFGTLPLKNISKFSIQSIVSHAITCLTVIKFHAKEMDDKNRQQVSVFKKFSCTSSVMVSIASFLLVTHGSWLEVGLSLARLIISALISPVLSLLFLLAK